MPESAILVPVPDAEPAVGRLRARLDRSAFADVIPHLTVGDRSEGGISALRAAEAQVLPMLPVRTRVSRGWLMTGTQAPGSWQRLTAFPLGQ